MIDVVPCTELHPLPDGELRLLGACRSVTGAMTRIETGGARLLVDCGVAQGREARDFVFPDAARDVDAVVLTHGHLDHIGNLPALLDSSFDAPIFATKATLEVSAVSLEDAMEMQRASRREVSDVLDRFRALSVPVPYDRAVDVPRLRGSIALRDAGHILGSASLEVTTSQSRVIVSGDLGRPCSPILRDPNTTWATGRPVDLVVLESTYGSRTHAHAPTTLLGPLREVIERAVATKGRVLIPAFAIGRTQLLLYFLNQLVESRAIPPVTVAVDTPMGLAITETYDRFRSLFDKESLDRIARGDDPLDFESLYAVKRGSDSRRLEEIEGPLVIIAGSGMCTGGRIVRHLVDGLPDDTTTVLFVGHQAAGTPGQRILEAGKRGGRVTIDGREVEVRARIEQLAGLSAHADREELRAWLGAIPDVQRVALHHGDEEAQHAFASFAR